MYHAYLDTDWLDEMYHEYELWTIYLNDPNGLFTDWIDVMNREFEAWNIWVAAGNPEPSFNLDG